MKFTEKVENFFKSEGIVNLSPESDAEPYFSWRPCECCGSPLGGDRYNVTGYDPETKEVYSYTICVDCMLYVANGDIPDGEE